MSKSNQKRFNRRDCNSTSSLERFCGLSNDRANCSPEYDWQSDS